MKNRGRILDLASKSASPFGQIYWVMREKALALLGKNRHFSGEGNPTFLSRSDMEFLEMQMGAAMEREVKGLEKNLFVLSTVVSLAPFLGILGTVWGILIALFEMQGGSSLHSSSVIMGGLSMALATTVLGLVIAIPALIAHNYLRNMIRNMHREMHEFGNEVLGVIELQFRKVEL
ncbi:MAG: MotA/TolQ/ExbB proton channel family protein [Simkaniaceae bacterium]|nr:MotA/TolQ/ExbB proton channel family protein [Simkaniaceae bacterium]